MSVPKVPFEVVPIDQDFLTVFADWHALRAVFPETGCSANWVNAFVMVALHMFFECRNVTKSLATTPAAKVCIYRSGSFV